jgi:DNA-binding HxlR family transcriptional regulator
MSSSVRSRASDTPPASLSAYCPQFHKAIEILGRRWTGAIVRALLAGESRFNQIKETVDGISERLLAERLRELEREGIVERIIHAEFPVRIEYVLTDKGNDLSAVVYALAEWAQRWIDDESPETGTMNKRRRAASTTARAG